MFGGGGGGDWSLLVILKHLFKCNVVQDGKLVCFGGKYWAQLHHRPIFTAKAY